MVDIDSTRAGRIKIILSIVFIIIFLSTMLLLYFFNRPFKAKMNLLLSRLPGPVGQFFESSFDKIEDKDKKNYLANHYISLDTPVAADKLYIIKRNNGKLYSEIIRIMNSISPSKTEEIIMLVRDIENNSGSLSAIYAAIKGKEEGTMSHEAAKLEGQDLLIAINEIEMRMERDKAFKEILPSIVASMNSNRLADILYYIDDSVEDKMLYSLEEAKRTEVENLLLAKRAEHSRLIDLADLYEMKPTEMAIDEIGNTQQYTIEELGIIYANLSVLKSAEILSHLEDDSFIEDLYASIRIEEELNRVEDSVTNHISKAMQFMTEYNKKLDDLVTIYGNMNASKAAEIVERMMDNDDTVTALEIDSEPVFEISDSSIIVDVLSRMKNKTLSNIMNYMDTDKASSLTQMLVEP